MDLKDWTAFRACFTDDFVSDTSSSGGKVIRGGDEVVAFVQRVLAKAVTVHGFGHYVEDYDRVDGQWRICSSKLTGLREEIRTPFSRCSSRKELAG
jgi:SnoaL-like domain